MNTNTELEQKPQVASPPVWIDRLAKLDGKNFELWKLYEDRADKLKSTLWTLGTWLATLLGAILALAFSSQLVVVDSNSLLEVKAALPLALLAGFGLLSSAYAFYVLCEIKHHIGSNWQRANYFRDHQPDQAREQGWCAVSYNSYDLILLFVVIGALLVAFLYLLLIAITYPPPAPCSGNLP